MPYRYDVVEGNFRQSDHPEIGILASVDLPDPSKPWWQQVPFRLPLVKDDLQPGDSWYVERLSRGIPEAGPAFVSVSTIDSDPDGTPVYHLTIEDPAFYNKPTPKKKGFLGGSSGGLAGALVGLALAAPTGGASIAWSTAALAAGSGAALGTIVGTGAEAAISGTQFEIGDVLQSAAISGGVAGVGAGITASLGPVTTAAGATLPPGVQGPVMASVTTPGLLSASAANTLGVLSSTVTRTALAPFAATSAALSETLAPVAQTVYRQPLPLSGGAVNTTGSTYFNYANSVDVPVAQPVGFFDSVLDSILPPFMHPDDLGRVDTPGDNRRDYGSGAASENPAGLIVAAIIIVIGAVAFARARARR
ncbi:MAG: hypothetical protein AAB262_11910 [Elusimicrobiota bacterium]